MMSVFIFKYKTKDQKGMSVLFAFYPNVNTDVGYKYSISFDNEYKIIQKEEKTSCLHFKLKEKSFELRKFSIWLRYKIGNVVIESNQNM